MMQRVKWLFYPLLFASFLFSSLQASTFQYIVFQPAKATFKVEKEAYESLSNHVKINVKAREEEPVPQQPTLAFYRYDITADTYLTVSKTDFQPNEEVSGTYNPMTPLLLENGVQIDISKKIPVLKCLVFKRDEPLIIVYHDSEIEDKKNIKLIISTDKDTEIVRLRHSDENTSLFVGYINTTTKCLRKCDGKLFVEKGTNIRASLEKVKESKSRSFSPSVFALASVEGEVIKSLAIEVKKEADIWIGMKASKDIASLGEFIKYTCMIENRGEKDVLDARLENRLSSGVVYRKNSFVFEDKKVKNLHISQDKKEFTFPFDIKAGEEKIFSFISLVDIDAKRSIQSRAFVKFNEKQSNSSLASSKIKKDFDDKSLIMGKVTLQDDENISLAGVRFYLDSGIFVHSDRRGKFHFEDVELGSHVVSIDTDSISGRFVTAECKVNARNMASKTSSFVNTRTSHIQKVDFCLKVDKQIQALNPTLSFSIPDIKKEKMPNFTERDFKKEKKTNLFLWPREDFVPPMPSLKVAFLHQANEKMELYLNGEKVDMLNYDGFVKQRNKKRIISKYRGIDIVDGDNILEAKILDKDAKVVKIIKRKIHLSTSPVIAKVLKEKSSLLSDGKSSPVIAVQLFDAAGYPLRFGMVGTFLVEKPYISKERLDALKENPLSNIKGEDKYTVLENGIAYIELQATTTSGEVKLHFPFQNSNEYTKVWLSSSPREWFIVGFAEGTVGYKTLKNTLKQTTESDLYHDKKISFFAKGKVGVDALLTIAYDSGKRADLGILEEINPASEYTVYADESLQQNEAPSSKKLYLKIEKKSFYALFGDFDT
ncbi:MAG TPA: hypothetical protein EYG75_01950, partial [Campylobacterales bacterium]|nr:hypothetical protein [Campylobacterales bacterium]